MKNSGFFRDDCSLWPESWWMQTTNGGYEGMWVLKVRLISLPYIFHVLYILFFTRPTYQMSVYRTIGPLVCIYEPLLLNVNSGLNTSDERERAVFFCYRLLIDLWFLFGGVSSSSLYLGQAALFYCVTPWAFHSRLSVILNISGTSWSISIKFYFNHH